VSPVWSRSSCRFLAVMCIRPCLVSAGRRLGEAARGLVAGRGLCRGADHSGGTRRGPAARPMRPPVPAQSEVNARRGEWRRTQPDVGPRPATSGLPGYVRCPVPDRGPGADGSSLPIGGLRPPVARIPVGSDHLARQERGGDPTGCPGLDPMGTMHRRGDAGHDRNVATRGRRRPFVRGAGRLPPRSADVTAEAGRHRTNVRDRLRHRRDRPHSRFLVACSRAEETHSGRGEGRTARHEKGRLGLSSAGRGTRYRTVATG